MLKSSYGIGDIVKDDNTNRFYRVTENAIQNKATIAVDDPELKFMRLATSKEIEHMSG